MNKGRPMDKKRYAIQAKRYPANKDWTDWAVTDDYDEATRHLEQIKALGHCGRIVDKGGIAKVVKMLEDEYEKAKKLDYIKNPLSVALYAVWKKVDKEEKKK